ncbi:MAG TPA: fibronectin type III domain-containing protein, partial [Marmoricola sp.]|nr:fibronectin type III domain-containing protein [Marmoricola sp.]
AGIATLMMGGDYHDWNLLTPNAPNNLRARQVAGRRVQATWTAPAARGTSIRGYYVKRDSGAWIKVTSRSWTSGALARGTHVVSVRSFNARGSSPIRTVRIILN